MKQETREEAAEKEFPLLNTEWFKKGAAEEENLQLLGHRKSFIKGAKWQQKRSDEEVEVENKWEGNGTMFGFKMGNASPDGEFVNKIIIPKEEPKQETLEEVELAILFHNTYERLAPSFGYETRVDTKLFETTTPNGMLMIAVCKEIIKWQQERMYSEEELREAFNKGMTFERGEYQSENTYNEFTGFQKPNKELSFEEWFNQFKKK
jgi:hypothetical protein